MNKKIKRIFAAVLSLLMLAGLSMLTACGGDGKEPEEPVTIVYEGGALPAAEVTVSYSASVATATGADEITYTMSKGALPSGLTLATDGTLSGKPAKDGDFSFTVKATAGTASATADFTLTVNKHYYEITYSGSVLPAATVDEAYTASVATATTTGTEPIAYSTEDTLPAGLALAADGTISGTPTEATDGALSFTVTASAEDAHPVTATFSLTVAEGQMRASARLTPHPLRRQRAPRTSNTRCTRALRFPQGSRSAKTELFREPLRVTPHLTASRCSRLPMVPSVRRRSSRCSSSLPRR